MPRRRQSFNLIFWWRRCVEQSRSRIDRVLVLVSSTWNFNVARVLEEFLEVDLRVAECPALTLVVLHRVNQRRFGLYHCACPPTTAAGGR